MLLHFADNPKEGEKDEESYRFFMVATIFLGGCGTTSTGGKIGRAVGGAGGLFAGYQIARRNTDDPAGRLVGALIGAALGATGGEAVGERIYKLSHQDAAKVAANTGQEGVFTPTGSSLNGHYFVARPDRSRRREVYYGGEGSCSWTLEEEFVNGVSRGTRSARVCKGRDCQVDCVWSFKTPKYLN